ncbi:MAG TPA: rhodanese-like domain-containing protein [Tepidisphaeraceae bacterium]|nr:rhodanese-like domain-containing protein [Tepidisphaeraceae bacterium]
MPVNNISIEQCRRLIDSGQTLNILDVRTPAEFCQLHATGARLLPLDELNPAAIAAQPRNDDEPLYVICHSGGRATEACRRLADAGASHVYCIEGGTAAWERAGLPVQRGSIRVMSLERQVRVAAGSLVLLSVALGWFVHPAFLALTAFIGAGLTFAGITDTCGMAMLLAKLPWNRAQACS